MPCAQSFRWFRAISSLLWALGKGELVLHNKWLPLFPGGMGSSGIVVLVRALLAVAAGPFVVQVSNVAPERIPSDVEWTQETMAATSRGDAFRGMLLARKCEHCHGAEGFSSEAPTPNLAGLDRLSLWKELQDFKARKRWSRAMNPIAESLSARDLADVVAYYAKVPVFSDLQDNRMFPKPAPGPAHAAMASRLISFGDGGRGIPPCQACHGPIAYRPGAPSLMNQNAEYVLNQLEAFANRTRTNDINEPMRTIAALLTDEERHALAEYYGAGLGRQPGGVEASK